MSRELAISIAFVAGALLAIGVSILSDRRRIHHAIRHGYNLAVDQMTKGGFYYGKDGKSHRVHVFHEQQIGG